MDESLYHKDRQYLTTCRVVSHPLHGMTESVSCRRADHDLTVVSNPPLIASVSKAKSFANSSHTSLSFTISSPSNTNNTAIIWAISSQNPKSPSVTANLAQHNFAGRSHLYMLNSLVSDSSPTFTSPSQPVISNAIMTTASPRATQKIESSSSRSSTAGGLPITTTFRTKASPVLIAHVVCGTLATLLFFPIGSITPRYARAFTRKRWWLPVHSTFNGVLGASCVVAAFSIARSQFHLAGGFDTLHRKCGLALFILTLIQVTLGIAMPWPKPLMMEKTKVAGRGALSYLHLILGLALVSLGWVTVYEGLWHEWPTWSTNGPANRAYKIAFVVLVGVFALAYIVGVGLLPRQLRAEKAEMEGVDEHGRLAGEGVKRSKSDASSFCTEEHAE